ncbi:arabinosyltransferase domain-containing protein [Nocardia sp. NPDC057353]|uniref:arabinosyltransferase domain-containing protein n=1 Tax=Nocardia sp. NPDC057353 TaxID=3346104 RepID=UPI0036388381
MAETMVRAGRGPSVNDPDPVRAPGGARRWAAPVALIAGLFGMLCAIAVPLLPVRVDATTLEWPQGGTPASVEAPLVAYAPLTFDATIPCAAVEQLPGGGVLAATAPAGAPDLERYGFIAQVRPGTPAPDADGSGAPVPGADGSDGAVPGADGSGAAAGQAGEQAPARLDVVLRNQALLSTPVTDLPPGCTLTLRADGDGATFAGAGGAPVTLAGDYRPQVVGLFSDLPDPAGATMRAEVDSRFSSTPSTLKLLAIWGAALSTVLALAALYVLDRRDGLRPRRVLPARWWRCTPLDGFVAAVLVLWYFIGSTTSDDGYQFGMARTSGTAGYMANYFRWFGVPENPVGTPYYDLIRVMAEISTASPFVRLPTLAAGLLIWLLISREVVPRFGTAVRHHRVARWTGALAFLAVWLPYDNGLRPEPVVALAIVLTWCSMERAIATGRLLPAAVAVLVAAFACTAGPSGVLCIAALLAGLRPLAHIVRRRAAGSGSFRSGLSLAAPIGAAGTLVLAVAFADQPLSALFEMQRVHAIAGPDVKWFQEYLRYQYLLQPEVDGSFARRAGIFLLVAGLLTCVLVLLRKGGRIPTTAAGPTRRALGTAVGALLLLMTTPTKWTHHLGVFAGVAGMVAVLAAVAVAPAVMKAPRNRALFAAVLAFLLALACTGDNGWWYVSSYGIPWWDKPVSLAGIQLSTVFLALAVGLLAVAAWWQVRAPEPGTPHRISGFARRVSAAPVLAMALAFAVLLQVASFGKAAISRYPAFTLASSNISAVLGEPCGLADQVLVETDPTGSVLPPLTGDAAAALAGTGTGFVPGGVAADLRPDDEGSASGSIADALTGATDSDTAEGTRTAALPFGLDPALVPMLGSYGSGDAGPAELTTGWYRLPAERDGIVAIGAAGRIRSVDSDGVVTPGQSVALEYGTADGVPGGRVLPIDIGPAPSWRNLRVPLADIPAEAEVVRIVAADRDRNPAQWVALTPPRVPRTSTLNEVVGSAAPVLLDWMVGLQFPCQRPFDHRHGIAEVPEYRVLPDRPGAEITSLWQNHDGGGPLGWTTLLLRAETLPTYLAHDWRRDWGELQRFTRIDPSAVPARAQVVQESRSGLWTPGPILTGY